MSTWTIRRAGGELRVSGGRNAFTNGTYVLVLFRRDFAGRITDLTAATQRIQKLQFVKRGE